MANETESRRWCSVWLTREEWQELRPIVKERNIKNYPSENDGVELSVYVNKEEKDYLDERLRIFTAH